MALALAMQAGNFTSTLGSLHSKEFYLKDGDVRRIMGRVVDKCLKSSSREQRIVCEKTSLNVLVFERLADMLPRAKFVHALRDGRDVASSLLMRGWRDPKTGKKFPHVEYPEAAAGYWKALVEIGLRAEAALTSSGRIMRIAYEDVAKAPEIVLPGLIAFLGAAPNAKPPEAAGAMQLNAIESESLPLLFQPVTASRISIAKTRLSPDVYQRVDTIVRPVMARLKPA